MSQRVENIGAGEGNRTLVISLEGCCSTIELHPRTQSPTCELAFGKTSAGSSRSAGLPAAAPQARRLVGEVGLEPTKAKPADLQAAGLPPKTPILSAFPPFHVAFVSRRGLLFSVQRVNPVSGFAPHPNSAFAAAASSARSSPPGNRCP